MLGGLLTATGLRSNQESVQFAVLPAPRRCRTRARTDWPSADRNCAREYPKRCEAEPRLRRVSPNPPKEGVGVSVLKRQEGAPVLLGEWFCSKKPTPEKEHPIEAATQPPRPDPNHLRRRPLGGQCRAAPSGHPGAAPRPARTRPAAPRPGRCPGAGEHERQDDDAGGVLRWLGATALTTPMCCAPGGRPAPWAARSRRHPPWAPSCAASGGATSVNSTG